tara:strand:- start:636 stop:752 length:117 start_codon:yes stop_codon:yes gene_type:complete
MIIIYLTHLANPAVAAYLQEHPKLADDFTAAFYATVGG